MSTLEQISLIIPPTLGAPWLLRLARASKDATSWVAQFIIYVWLIYLQFIQHYSATVGLNILWYGRSIHVNSSWVFPLGLISIFYAFLTYDPKTFRRMLRYIILANFVMAGLITFQRHNIFSIFPATWSRFYEDGAAFILAFGTLLLILDIGTMVLLYIFICKHTSNNFWTIWAPLIAALVFDAFGFSFVVAYCHGDDPWPVFYDQLGAKLLAGTVCAGWFSLFTWYSKISLLIMNQVGAIRRFFPEALPIQHRIFRRLVPVTTNPVSNLTQPVDSGIGQSNMREHGKDAAQSGPEKQEPDRAKSVSPDQQTFADAVGGPTRHGISQSIIRQKYEAEDLALPKADVAIDPAFLLPYTGEWIAWSPDGRNVVAHDKDPVILEKLLKASGLEMSQCVLDYIDEGTEI